MGKNIIIQETGVDTSLNNIDKLRTKQLGGGTVNWVPEDETQRTDLTVAENGTYTASDDGYYCYGNVTVDVAGGGGSWVSGTAPDGNDYIFEFDDSTGDVTQALLPSSIAVTVNPTKDEYIDGEGIDISGIEVTAYDGNGNVWTSADYPDGVIPIGELAYEPTVADIDSVEGGDVYEKNGVVATAFTTSVFYADSYYGDVYYYPKSFLLSDPFWNYLTTRPYPATVFYTRYNGEVYGASDNANVMFIGAYNSEYLDKRRGTAPAYASNSMTFEWNSHNVESNFPPDFVSMIPVSSVNPLNVDFSGAQLIEATQKITVKWHRPGDSEELSATFGVKVEWRSSGGGDF